MSFLCEVMHLLGFEIIFSVSSVPDILDPSESIDSESSLPTVGHSSCIDDM